MRNELEQIVIKYGAYWSIALLAVVITKLFSEKKETFKTVLRSAMACIVITILIVENVKDPSDFSTVIVYVVIGAICSDTIWTGLIRFGPSIIQLIIKGVGK